MARRILVLEKEVLLAEKLTDAGYQVVAPTTAVLADATRLAQSESLDAAILDIDPGDDTSEDIVGKPFNPQELIPHLESILQAAE